MARPGPTASAARSLESLVFMIKNQNKYLWLISVHHSTSDSCIIINAADDTSEKCDDGDDDW